eukprot:s583_g2.t2
MAGALAQRIPESAPRMTSQEVSNYLLAVALHDGEDGGLTKIGDQTLLAGVQRLKQLLPKLTKQQLFIHAPTVLWACARAGHRDVDLLTRLANKYQNLAKRLPTWSLLSMAWSFERLGAPGFKEFQEVLRANIEMRGLTRADVELSQKGPLEWAAATKSPRRTSQEEQRKVELQAKLQHMEHKMVQGKQIMEQAIQQEQELKKHEKRLRKQQERETELRQIEEQQRQENLLLEERCASQEEQVVKLTTKLQKLWDKYQKAQQEMVDLQHFNQQEREDMLSMIRDLRQTLKLKALIMESFVPMKEIQNTQERAAWDAEEDEWRIQPVTLDKENRPKRPNSVMGLPRPTSEFARLNRTMGDSNPRYMYDNIVFTDLDLPERTTEDYEVQPELGDRIERAITLALSHDDDDVKEAKAPTHHTGRCSACEFAPDMAHATRGRSSFRIARAALIALLLAGAPPCMDFFAWPAPGYSRGRPRSTTRWAAETTEPATQSQAEEPRPSDHRLRELRTRVAALRAQMVQQRREINELTKELLKEELLCATRSPEQNGFDRLFRSVGVLIHTAWKNGDPVSFVYNQTGTAIRVAGQTAASGELIRDVLPNAPTLLTVAPEAIRSLSPVDFFNRLQDTRALVLAVLEQSEDSEDAQEQWDDHSELRFLSPALFRKGIEVVATRPARGWSVVVIERKHHGGGRAQELRTWLCGDFLGSREHWWKLWSDCPAASRNFTASNWGVASDPHTYNALGIKYVVNCSCELPFVDEVLNVQGLGTADPRHEVEGLQGPFLQLSRKSWGQQPIHAELRVKLAGRLRVPVQDGADQRICEHFLESCKLLLRPRFLERSVGAQSGHVLIHCKHGQSRSATVLAAFMLHVAKQMGTPTTAEEVLVRLRASRPRVRLYAHASRLDRHLPQILSDYGSVSPAAQQIASVPTACIFILAVELCERLAFYTFTGTQALLRSVCLLLFLSEFFLEKTGYSLAQANALTTAMSTLCMAWAVFAGWVADVQLGRFRTIIIFGVVYSIGGLAATVAASPRWMSSGLYLFALLVLVPMGTAGIKSNISNFGADQYDMTDPEQVAAQAQFFQWFYMAINVGSAFAYGFLTTLGTNGGLGISKDACDYGYFAAYFLASVAMAVAVMAFIAVRGRYRTSPLLHTSAMADVCQRVWKELGNGSGMAQACVTGAFLSALAIVLSVVGALMQHQMPGRISDADLPGVSLSPEDARGFLRLLPVIITAQLSCGHPRMQYSFQQQACQMDVRIPFGGEAQFAGSFFMMLGCSIGQTCECCIVSARIADCLGIAIATPVAVGWLNPMLEKKLGRYFSHDGKFVFGMAVGGASVVVAAVLESVRKAARVSDRLSNCAPDGIHMSSVSAVWMFLPFLMMGIGEIYTNPVIMHLVYSSSSAATRTLAVVATLLVQAVSTAIFGVQARGLP